MNRIFIDFETYSDLNVAEVGAYKQSEHFSTDVLCLGYAFNDGHPEIWKLENKKPGFKYPADLFSKITRGDSIYAWNVEYEYSIWQNVCVKKYNWPELPIKQLRDVQAIALNFSLPASLEKCGEVLNLPIQKDPKGKRLINLLSKPQNPTKNHPQKRRTPDQYPDLFNELYDYCKTDVIVTREILKHLPWELSKQELNIFHHTLVKNLRGIPIDVELVKKINNRLDEYLKEVQTMVPIITDGFVETINQRDKILEWCKNQGIALPDLQVATVKKYLQAGIINKIPAVKSLLELRQLAGKSSIKKFKKILQSVCKDGRLRNCLKYHKATTGREGGRFLQPQNLPRESIDNVDETIELFKNNPLEKILEQHDDIIKISSALIRPSICAENGNKLIVSDFSQIENRALLWLANQQDILDKIEEGLCQYTDMASTLYNKPYDEIEKNERFYGKTVILGCGYGMGAKTFQKNCTENKINVSIAESKKTINLFRDKYYMVVQFWYSLQDAAIRAVENPEYLTKYNSIEFFYTKNYLFMVLPNNKQICYPSPEIEFRTTQWGKTYKSLVHMGINSLTKKWEKLLLTPGRLAENATQALSREILFEAVLDMERKRLPVILTVHDEIVLEDFKKSPVTIDEINKIMCNRSKIFAGLPLKASGYETKRYRK